MTDNEIIKDLKYVVKQAEKSNSVVCESLTHMLSKTLDLINRQKAEKESLIAGQETLQKYIAEQKAEIDRLEHQLETLCLTLKLAKAEAYKECIEKVKTLVNPDSSFDFRQELDNLLKEKVGEDK